MKGYFDNPEIKKSSIIFVLIMSVFLLCSYILIKINNDRMKRDYIRVMGSIAGKILEKDPELEKEIVPLMTRETSKEEMERGRDILRQYGLSETLDTGLFPYIKGSFIQGELSMLFAGTVLAIILFSFNYLQYGYFYKNMRAFRHAAKKIVEGDYNLKLSEEKEGDLSKLTKCFNSMGEVIRGNIYDLEKEKRFLIDLLSDISHQLKTPLSSMIVYNDIMLSKELTKEQRETFLKNNQNVLNRMSWLILSLLKLAKMDASAIELQIEEQSLVETVEEALEIMEEKAQEVKVNLEFLQKEEISFRHDRLWLQEALINIIKNGIEHTVAGGKVTVQLEDNPAFTRIIIRDDGEGIPEEELVHIFKRFYKGKKSKKNDSIGIGLALSRSIIERHGGYIEASSRINEGTSFMITFLKY